MYRRLPTGEDKLYCFKNIYLCMSRVLYYELGQLLHWGQGYRIYPRDEDLYIDTRAIARMSNLYTGPHQRGYIYTKCLFTGNFSISRLNPNIYQTKSRNLRKLCLIYNKQRRLNPYKYTHRTCIISQLKELLRPYNIHKYTLSFLYNIHIIYIYTSSKIGHYVYQYVRVSSIWKLFIWKH